MVFTVSSADLLKQLQVAAGAITTNPVLPILEDFLFSITGNTLTITATDLESTITNSIEVSADKDGIVAVPAKILLDTLKMLPEQPVTFNVNDANFGIEMTVSNGKYKLAGENGTDFPRTPVSDDIDKIVMNSDILINGITKTIFASSTDDLRQAMTGVNFVIDERTITFVATDAHKLVKYTFGGIEANGSTSFILPKKSLNLLKSALTYNKEVIMSYNQSNVFFQFDNVKMSARLIDAKYPDYNAVIPVNNPNIITINRKELLGTLKRIINYSNKTTNQVVLNIAEKSLTVSAQDLDFSNEATEQLPCEYNATDMVIGFNAKFLIEMLGTLESDDIYIELSAPSRAGILRPLEEVAGEDILMLVMPVMLSN
jgi:DNA polymerase III subunit beta